MLDFRNVPRVYEDMTDAGREARTTVRFPVEQPETGRSRGLSGRQAATTPRSTTPLRRPDGVARGVWSVFFEENRAPALAHQALAAIKKITAYAQAGRFLSVHCAQPWARSSQAGQLPQP